MSERDGKQALDYHNTVRAQHGAPPLIWSDVLAAGAQEWANYLAKCNTLEHAKYTGYGENIAFSSGMRMSGRTASESWYAEEEVYDYSNPNFHNDTGHFTQMVWVSTNLFGFGISRGRDGREYAVARYYPQGNIIGQFEQNVIQNFSRPSIPQTPETPCIPKSLELSFAETALEWMNLCRQRHRAPPVQLDQEMCELACNVAQYFLDVNLRRPIRTDHSKCRYGRSLHISCGPQVPDGKYFIQRLYRGESNYNYNHDRSNKDTASFSLLVWNSCAKVGIGIATYEKYTSMVALYDPPGNVEGKYRLEVQRPDPSIPDPFRN